MKVKEEMKEEENGKLCKKNMVIKVSKVKIFTKDSFGHNTMSLVSKRKSNSFRWRLNEMLLQTEVIVKLVKRN